MANHKRKKPKHLRAGCLMCKPEKDDRGKNSEKHIKPSERRKLMDPISKDLEKEYGSEYEEPKRGRPGFDEGE